MFSIDLMVGIDVRIVFKRLPLCVHHSVSVNVEESMKYKSGTENGVFRR